MVQNTQKGNFLDKRQIRYSEREYVNWGLQLRKRKLSGIIFIVLFLYPLGADAFDIERNLGVGEFFAAYSIAGTGWRIEGSFSTNRDIEFFICDSSNYTRWNRNENIIHFEHSEETSGKAFNFTVPYNSSWYVIFSNLQSNNIIELNAEFFFIDNSGYTYTQVAWIAQSTILTPMFIGLLIAILSVCLIGIWASRRSETQPVVNYEKILPKPS